MKTVQGQLFEEEVLNIDDTHYVDCTLTNCQLRYSGHPVAFERTRLNGCRYVFYGHARGFIHFLQHVGLMPYSSSEWGEFSQQVQ